MTIPGIVAVSANAMKRRRKIGTLLIDLNMAASIPSHNYEVRALLDYQGVLGYSGLVTASASGYTGINEPFCHWNRYACAKMFSPSIPAPEVANCTGPCTVSNTPVWSSLMSAFLSRLF